VPAAEKQGFRRVLGSLARPPWSLAVLAWLTALLLQTGAFGTVDTSRRYQVTRALWRGELPVAPEDVGFGIVTATGAVHPWYGVGQSLIMLPGDLLASALTKLAGLGPPLRPKLEMAIVAAVTFPLITALTAVLAYTALREVGRFSERLAALGVVVWLLGTTVLHYVHVQFENSLDLLLYLVMIVHGVRWAEHGARRNLLWVALAAGLNLLVRVPNVVDAVLLVAAVTAARMPPGPERAPWLRRRAVDLALVWVPVMALALLLDRAYQVHRFGWDAVGTTYLHLFGLQERARNPALPPGYPFSGSFWEGFWGPLVDPNRALFLYDPLAVVAFGMLFLAWRRRELPRGLPVLVAACGVAVLARIVLCARLEFWDGGTSWSNRYSLTPFQTATLLGLPLALQAAATRGKARVALAGVVALSVCLQLTSVLAHPNLEQVQSGCRHGSDRMMPDRLENAARLLFGAAPERLSEGGCVPELYRRVHLLPWDNARDLPVRARPVVLVGWLGLLAAWLAWLLATLRPRPAAS
jgi:hypothetical protein